MRKTTLSILLLLLLTISLIGCGSNDTASEGTEPEENKLEEQVIDNDEEKEKSDLEKVFEEATAENTLTNEEMIAIGQKLYSNGFNSLYEAKSEEEVLNNTEKYFSFSKDYSEGLIKVYNEYKDDKYVVLEEKFESNKVNKTSNDSFVHDFIVTTILQDKNGKKYSVKESIRMEIVQVDTEFKIITHSGNILEDVEIN